MPAVVVGWLVLAAPVVAGAQARTPSTFEVASVRLSAPESRSSQQVLDTRVTLIGQPLQSLLRLAFRAKDYQLSAPGWLADVRVDVQATLPPGTTRQQVPEMLQALLTQRFGLLVHRESRPIDVYELLVDAGGPKSMEVVAPVNELDRALPTSPGLARDLADRVSETPDGSIRTVMSGSGDLGDIVRTTVTARSRYSLTMSKERTQILSATRMAMADFAGLLEGVIGEPVLDKTSLPALYRFTINLPLDNVARQSLMRGAALFGGSPSDSPFAASPLPMVSDGLKRLGLRLEKRRSPIDTVVVDRIERTPTDN